MNDVEVHATDLSELCFGDRFSPLASIIVAPDDGQWRDLAQLIQNGRLANVASMDDVIGTTKVLDCLGTKHVVGVRDHADAQHGWCVRPNFDISRNFAG